MTFPAQFNLSDLNGDNGFVLNGTNRTDSAGASVSNAGDVNGDGIDDLIIGAPYATSNGFSSGESYVVFGSDQNFTPSLELADLDGSNGFVVNGVERYDRSGGSVSGAGDINGDGFDDLIIGFDSYCGTYCEPSGATSYVVFGSGQGFAASLELTDLDGSNGFTLNGIDEGDNSGGSVSGAGDINGDGIDDLIIGVSGSTPGTVVFGSDQGFAASLNVSDLDGSNGFTLNGSGRSVSGAGDINGDGIDDLIIGVSGASPNGNRGAGKSYVVFGSDEGFATSVNLADLDGSNGFALNGIDEYDRSGGSVSGAGDINGDGIDDLIIGAINADPNGSLSGESYVVFGSDQGFTPSLDLADLDGGNGFVFNGIDAQDFSGGSVSGAGDINGDGFDDLIIGAPFASPSGRGNAEIGQSYVVFGSDQGFAASLDPRDLDGSNGFVLNGIEQYDYAGWSVSGAGDFNGDGIDDLLIGAREASPNGTLGAGEIYVVFGRGPSTRNDVLTGTSGRDVIFALAGNDRVRGLAGNDRLAGQEGNDRLIGGTGRDNLLGGSGQDTLLGGADDDRLLGGTDDDRLNGDGGNDRLVGGAGIDTLRGDAGADTLVGGVGNDTLLGGSGNDRLLGSAGDDVLNGQSGNDILRGGSGNDVLRGGIGNDRLIGNQGNDLITTGEGSDRIFIRIGQGFDRVTDFSDGQDLIVLGGIRFDQLSIQQLNNNVLISVGDERLLRLNNIQVAAISAADFV